MKLNVDNVSLVKLWDDYFANDSFEDEPCDYHGYEITLNNNRVGTIEIIDCFNDYNDICYVERIDIDDDYRSQGIGTTVLTKSLGAEGYWRAVVAPDNNDAKRLYQRIGEESNYIPGCDTDFGDFDQGYGVFIIDC